MTKSETKKWSAFNGMKCTSKNAKLSNIHVFK